MSKNDPVWKMLGQPEPPIELGYWDYGTVFRASDPRECFFWFRELGRAIYWDLWSYYYWGKKVRKAFRALGSEIWTRAVTLAGDWWVGRLNLRSIVADVNSRRSARGEEAPDGLCDLLRAPGEPDQEDRGLHVVEPVGR